MKIRRFTASGKPYAALVQYEDKVYSYKVFVDLVNYTFCGTSTTNGRACVYAGKAESLPHQVKGLLDIHDIQWYVSVYKAISGWKAALYGPEGPEQTGVGTWGTKDEAAAEGEEWARDVGVPYVEWE